MPWQITWEGDVFREGDLTVGEAKQVCKLTGADWAKIHPLTSPEHLTALVAVFAARKGAVVDDTIARLDGLPLNDVLDFVSRVADDDLPATYEDGIPKAES